MTVTIEGLAMLTVREKAALVLPVWTVSAAEGVYVPVMLAMPAWVEPKVALHDAVPTGFEPCARVQGDEEPNPPFAVPVAEKFTVPAGVVGVVPVVVSTTVAVQVDD